MNNNINILNIAHLNINSLKSIAKQMELNEYLIKTNLDIIALNETNLKKTHNFDL